MKLGGPLKKSDYALQLLFAPLKARYFTLTVSREGGARQVPRLTSLKHTTVYNPDNDLIWEYETDWTRSATTDMRTFSPDVRMQTL